MYISADAYILIKKFIEVCSCFLCPILNGSVVDLDQNRQQTNTRSGVGYYMTPGAPFTNMV